MLPESGIHVTRIGYSCIGTSFENCLENLKKSLERCETHDLILNWEKCHFMAPSSSSSISLIITIIKGVLHKSRFRFINQKLTLLRRYRYIFEAKGKWKYIMGTSKVREAQESQARQSLQRWSQPDIFHASQSGYSRRGTGGSDSRVTGDSDSISNRRKNSLPSGLSSARPREVRFRCGVIRRGLRYDIYRGNWVRVVGGIITRHFDIRS
ncbi:hypothetical protein OSB04_un001157 [Centaurea solstitialis]|uniref:Uncharacterized protein n=1 Tax=Centaurea solstitialis TaxID=347529 RepID=A0AA38SGM0_9ASTR|nr:hypothetical protein OSB04_un001157 [Centaurea solstitialis]